MSRVNNLEYTGICGVTMDLAGSSGFPPTSNNNTLGDDHSSHSPSEDGSSYLQYPDIQKTEPDVEEDSNASLTSQTLNSDGTPKRPMNAFMIFARRRRPQVSSENQSMRTGEISKILSREWNSMEMAEKQFYLDQAKQLKETFNSKYPDYVYRRRPNNSRKRRRGEMGSNRSIDSTVSADPGDDLAGGTDIRESPVDGDGYLTDHSDLHHRRMPSDSPTTYTHPNHFTPASSRHPSYDYSSSDISYRQLTSNDPRLQYSPDRPPTDATENSAHSHRYQPYIHSQSQTHASNVYPSDQSAAQGWDDRDHGGRAGAPPWPGSHQDRPVTSVSSSKAYPPPSDWPAPPSTSASAGHSPNFPFPTLSAPFFPNQSHLSGNYPTSSSPPSAHSPSVAHYSTGQIPSSSMAGRHGPGYDPRNYTSSPSLSPSHSYPAGSRESHLYQQHHSRSSGFSRGPPSVQSISSFSQSQPMQSSPPTSTAGGAPSAPPLGYWSREKLDEQ